MRTRISDVFHFQATIFTLFLAFLLFTNHLFAVVYVDHGASGAGTGESWADAFTDIQDGLDAAAAEEEVWVATAVYYENVVIPAGVRLYGGFSGDGTEVSVHQRRPELYPTLIDGDFLGSTVTMNDGCLIDGFLITNGYGTEVGLDTYIGGGVYAVNSDVTIANCVIYGNYADDAGGGIAFITGTAIIYNNIIAENTSDVRGGGIYLEAAGNTVIASNVIIGNDGGFAGGGADWSGSAPRVIDNLFCGNQADYGGGIESAGGTGSPESEGGSASGVPVEIPYLVRNIFCNNYSGTSGSGLDLYYGEITAAGNIVAGNVTAASGGVIAMDNGGGYIHRCTVTDNDGTGLDCLSSSPEVLGNIFSGNGYGLADDDSAPVLLSNLFYNNILGHYYDIDATLVYDTSSEINALDPPGMNSGNLVGNPGFTSEITGDWESVVHDSDSFMTTCTDSGAAWVPGELTGMFLQPDTDDKNLFLIIDNTDQTISVWGNAGVVAESGDDYTIHDYGISSGSVASDSGVDSYYVWYDLNRTCFSTDADGDEMFQPDIGALEASGVNLAAAMNPGFEETGGQPGYVSGKPTGWSASIQYGGDKTAVWASDDSTAHSGTHSALIETSGTPINPSDITTSSLVTENYMDLKTGETYQLSAWIRRSHSQWFRLIIFGYGFSIYHQEEFDSLETGEGDSGWQRHAITFTVPGSMGATSRFFLRVDSMVTNARTESGPCRMWVDDVEIVSLGAEIWADTWTAAPERYGIRNRYFGMGTESESVVLGGTTYSSTDMPAGWNIAMAVDFGSNDVPGSPQWFDVDSLPHINAMPPAAAVFAQALSTTGPAYPAIATDVRINFEGALSRRHSLKFSYGCNQEGTRPLLRAFVINPDFNHSAYLGVDPIIDVPADKMWPLSIHITPEPWETDLKIRFDVVTIGSTTGPHTDPVTAYLDNITLNVRE